MWSNSSNPIDKLNKVTFIPVLFQPNPGKQLKERDVAFWTKNSIHSYPFFLVNAHHHKKVLKSEVVGQFLDDTVIFADSGGLQAVTLKAGKPDIRELTLWQEEHSSIGFGFDELPFLTDVRKLTGWEFDKKNFLEYAKRSGENLGIALKTRTNSNFKIYGIIQGRTFEEYKQWLDVIKCYDVDGYCVKSPSNNPINVAESSLFAYHNIQKPVHFLGMSNFSKTLVIYYFSNYFKHKITFDSSTHNQGNQFRTFVHAVPSLKIRYIKDSDGLADDTNCILENPYDLSFCGCPACSFLSAFEFKELHISNDPRVGPLITLHNFINLSKMFKLTEQVNHSKNAMIRLAISLFRQQMSDRVVDAYNMIDEGIQKGYSYVSEKYTSLLTENTEIIKQKSILDF